MWGVVASVVPVYIIASADLQRLKIGKALDVEDRFLHLQRSSPDQLLLVGVLPGYTRAEADLHFTDQ